MTVRELTAELRKHPVHLNVLAFSSNPEKWGQIEDLRGFQLYKARYGHILNGVQFPGGGADGVSFVVIATGIHLGLSVERAVKELEGFEPELQVVFEPNGSSAAHDFVEVTEVKPEKFGIIKRSFRDIMDGRDFLDDVYVEDALQGVPKLLLWG